MKFTDIKNLIIGSLDADADTKEVSRQLENSGAVFGFREGFADKVLDRIYSTGMKVSREVDYLRSMNFVFYRIALTGLAAIIVLLISIYLKEGSLSMNSFLGLNDSNAESIICLLTGN